MANINEPVGGRFPASGQDLFQVVSQGGGVIWHLNQENNPWFNGTGNPVSFTGQVSGDLYLDTASGNIWQFNSTAWIQIGNAAGFSNVYEMGFREDFLSGGQMANTVQTQTNGISCDTSWGIQAIGSASGASANLIGSGNPFNPNTGVANFGILSLSAGAVSGRGLVIAKSLDFFSNGAIISCLGALGTGISPNQAATPWQFDFILTPDVSSSTSLCIRAGACVNTGVTSDPPTDGFWVRYDTAASDTLYTWETRASGVSTTSTANSVAPIFSAGGVNGLMPHFRIRSLVAGTILFSVNGGVETSISTNVTISNLSPFVQILSRTSGAAILDVDFFSFYTATGRT